MSSEEKKTWLLDAHIKIQEIFDTCQNSGEDWTAQLKKVFQEEIPKVYDQLPWLNETPAHQLQSGQVVRFRGMIQDMQDPEFYMNTYIVKGSDGVEVLKPGRYLDVVSCSPNEEILFNSQHCETKDRDGYFCISIPGENEWVKEVYGDQNPNVEISSPRKNVESSRKRRASEEMDQQTTVAAQNTSLPHSCETNQSSSEAKKLKEAETTKDHRDTRDTNGSLHSNVSALKSSKFPFPETEGVGCLLKIYDIEKEFILNDVVEVVGVLSMDPTMSCQNGEEDNSIFGQAMDLALPPSLAPRLHVLSLKKKSHCNPLLPSVVGRDTLSMCSSAIRELVGSVLDVAFLGDELAAEYFICHLISSVYLRQDIVPLGKFSVNLSGMTRELQEKNYPKLLYSLFESFTTHSHFLPMTLENMNKMNFVPKKDYQENSLKSGFLQLPSSLHLVVDETQLTAGQLDGKGLKNLTALGTLINWQKVDYDFQFHNLEQQTNVPVFILSEAKSMINSDFRIHFDPKHKDVSAAFSEVASLLTPQVLKEVRSYLTLARLTPYTLSENMQKTVQDDFVSSRRHEDGMSADDLHSLLTLAKLMAQSCGQLELTADIWKSAKMLEVERKGRLRPEEASRV